MSTTNHGSLIICAFPGTGKSVIANSPDLVPDHWRLWPRTPEGDYRGPILRDSDSSNYDKAHFPGNYIDEVERISSTYPDNIQLLSTHSAVLAMLNERRINHVIVGPAHRNQKEEYLERYRQRKSPEGFIKLMETNFESFLLDMLIHNLNASCCTGYWGLQPGEYLADKIEIGRAHV